MPLETYENNVPMLEARTKINLAIRKINDLVTTIENLKTEVDGIDLTNLNYVPRVSKGINDNTDVKHYFLTAQMGYYTSSSNVVNPPFENSKQGDWYTYSVIGHGGGVNRTVFVINSEGKMAVGAVHNGQFKGWNHVLEDIEPQHISDHTDVKSYFDTADTGYYSSGFDVTNPPFEGGRDNGWYTYSVVTHSEDSGHPNKTITAMNAKGQMATAAILYGVFDGWHHTVSPSQPITAPVEVHSTLTAQSLKVPASNPGQSGFSVESIPSGVMIQPVDSQGQGYPDSALKFVNGEWYIGSDLIMRDQTRQTL